MGLPPSTSESGLDMLARLFSLTLVVLVLGTSAGGAAPQFREERVYASCDDVSKLHLEALDDQRPTWSVDAPTGTAQEGDGCGTIDVARNGVPDLEDLEWEGTFTGNLDTLVVEAHMVRTPRFSGSLDVGLVVDGVEVLSPDTSITELTAVAGGSDNTQLVRFAVRGIGLVDDPEASGDVEHTVRITISGRYTVDDLALGWVWGTREWPAGVTFNAPTYGVRTIVVDA